LLADGAPTGGYPELAHVIAADWALAGQLPPGAAVYFREIDLPEARQKLSEQELGLQLIARSLRRWAGDTDEQGEGDAAAG
jgi:allophanate hydrolase subunit 2